MSAGRRGAGGEGRAGALGAGVADGGSLAQGETGGGRGNARFRATLVRVLLVQAVALALLGLLQAVYHG